MLDDFLLKLCLTGIVGLGIVNNRYPTTRAQVSRKARGSRHLEKAQELSLISAVFFTLIGLVGFCYSYPELFSIFHVANSDKVVYHSTYCQMGVQF